MRGVLLLVSRTFELIDSFAEKYLPKTNADNANVKLFFYSAIFFQNFFNFINILFINFVFIDSVSVPLLGTFYRPAWHLLIKYKSKLLIIR